MVGVIFTLGVDFEFFDVATVATRYVLEESLENFNTIQLDTLKRMTSGFGQLLDEEDKKAPLP